MRSPCTATKSSPRLPQLEKAHAQQRGPNAAKNNKYIYLFFQKEAYNIKEANNQIPNMVTHLLSAYYGLCIVTTHVDKDAK